MCGYICVHVYACICVYIHIPIYTQAYVYVYMHTHIKNCFPDHTSKRLKREGLESEDGRQEGQRSR